MEFQTRMGKGSFYDKKLLCFMIKRALNKMIDPLTKFRKQSMHLVVYLLISINKSTLLMQHRYKNNLTIFNQVESSLIKSNLI